MRTIFVLLALAFLPALCQAQIPTDTTNYQFSVTGLFDETNPSCISNCTETISMDFLYEANDDNVPNSPTAGIYGWINLSTLQIQSSGFLGSFSYPLDSGFYANYDLNDADAFPIYNSARDEVDLKGFTLLPPAPINLVLYSCPYSNDCLNAYPGVAPIDIYANRTTTEIVPVPAGDTEWELLLSSMFICMAGLWVKHRLDLTPSRLVHLRDC